MSSLPTEDAKFGQLWPVSSYFFNLEDSFERFYPKPKEITDECKVVLDLGETDGNNNERRTTDCCSKITSTDNILKSQTESEVKNVLDSDIYDDVSSVEDWPLSPNRLDEDDELDTSKRAPSSEETEETGGFGLDTDKKSVLVATFLEDDDKDQDRSLGKSAEEAAVGRAKRRRDEVDEDEENLSSKYCVKVTWNTEGSGSRKVISGSGAETRRIKLDRSPVAAPAPEVNDESSDAAAAIERKRQQRMVRFKDELDHLTLTSSNPVMKPTVKLEEEERSLIEERMVRFKDELDHLTLTASNPIKKPTVKLDEGERRPIVIDGCNVAFGASHDQSFDENGIKVCVGYFLNLGFTDITVVVPEFRLTNRGCKNPQILKELKEKRLLVTSWSRKLPNGQYVSLYDDRMIIEIAHKRGGIIISNDQYRDLLKERPDWAQTIGFRVLPFRFMPGKPDEIMFPADPLGRYGPTLEKFLRF